MRVCVCLCVCCLSTQYIYKYMTTVVVLNQKLWDIKYLYIYIWTEITDDIQKSPEKYSMGYSWCFFTLIANSNTTYLITDDTIINTVYHVVIEIVFLLHRRHSSIHYYYAKNMLSRSILYYHALPTSFMQQCYAYICYAPSVSSNYFCGLWFCAIHRVSPRKIVTGI